jgi:hypothetical protein
LTLSLGNQIFYSAFGHQQRHHPSHEVNRIINVKLSENNTLLEHWTCPKENHILYIWYRKFVPAQLQVSDEEDEAVGAWQVQ